MGGQRLKHEKWIRIKETAHKKVLVFFLLFGFMNGSAFGFGIAFVLYLGEKRGG
jgi:hypothetical protein